MFSLIQFNLLAAQWMGKEYSFLPCKDAFFDLNRYKTTIAYLRSLPLANIYCLSEVTTESLDEIKKEMPEYSGCFSPNDSNYWSEWLTPDSKKSKENGVCILYSNDLQREKSFGIDYGDGSRSVCCVLRYGEKRMRVCSVHFDDSTYKQQWEQLCNYLDKDKQQYDLDIISGDFNGFFSKIDNKHNYKEHRGMVVSSTTPLFHDPKLGAIDNTCIRTKHNINFHTETLTFDKDDMVIDRICQTVSKSGSDHYASRTTINI